MPFFYIYILMFLPRVGYSFTFDNKAPSVFCILPDDLSRVRILNQENYTSRKMSENVGTSEI